MCGLAGELRFDGAAADVAAVERMTGCLAPRGPDGSGSGPAARWRWATGGCRSST